MKRIGPRRRLVVNFDDVVLRVEDGDGGLVRGHFVGVQQREAHHDHAVATLAAVRRRADTKT